MTMYTGGETPKKSSTASMTSGPRHAAAGLTGRSESKAQMSASVSKPRGTPDKSDESRPTEIKTTTTKAYNAAVLAERFAGLKLALDSINNRPTSTSAYNSTARKQPTPAAPSLLTTEVATRPSKRPRLDEN